VPDRDGKKPNLGTQRVNSQTQVAIVGAGPAGLVLGHLLHAAGIESVVLEARDRDYVQKRVRAGVLEQGTVDLMIEMGVGDRLKREGLVHEGLELRYQGRGHRIDLTELSGGRAITIYGQQEVVKDLIDARLAFGGPLLFDAGDVSVHDFGGDRPRVRYTHDGDEHELTCDFIAGCDGFHGVSRPSMPAGVVSDHEHVYPYAWLGVLAAVAPSSDELVYCRHERGFALHSLRTPELSRLYLQCDPGDDIANWPDDRIWEELQTRFATDDPGWVLTEGPIVEKGITPMRSYVAEPMQHGRMFIAGDAAHIVPPTGAKGLNLAVHDVRVLADGIGDWYASGDDAKLRAYTETCLRRVWRVQHFSWWMTSMLHKAPDQDAFQDRLQIAQLDYVTRSRAGATTLAENYVGLEQV
jgi:p-hydroxybenzoate 3-monooxygenase